MFLERIRFCPVEILPPPPPLNSGKIINVTLTANAT